MKCSRWHHRIALYAGGDLETNHARRVEQHLDECPACRELSKALSGDLEVLAGIESDELAGVDLGSVRGNVMAEIEKLPASPIAAFLSSHHRLAMVAAVVVVFAALVVMWPGGGQEKPQMAEENLREATAAAEILIEAGPEESESPTATVPDTPVQRLPEPEQEGPILVAHAEPPLAEHSTVISPSALVEPMTMKILTDDPDVVIYWIVGSKGEKENA